MYDVIIVGAGAAGLTAGLYAGRYKLNTLILEKMAAGGQIILSERIENYPGFPGGIATQDLIVRMKQQVAELGVAIETEEVLEIIPHAESDNIFFTLKGSYNPVYQARGVILATGARWKRLGVPGEERLIGRGVSYCGACDGPLFKDKEVVVVGGGDTAFEEALFLTRYATKVHLVHRRQGFRAAKILEEKVTASPKIDFLLNAVIEEILGQSRVEAVRIKDVKTNALSQLSCQGVFIFVGIQANVDCIKNLLRLDEMGFIITEHDLRTSQKGIFAAGDCIKKGLYQMITACAEGATAAHSCYAYLSSRI